MRWHLLILHDSNDFVFQLFKTETLNVIRLSLIVLSFLNVALANSENKKTELFKFCWKSELENVSTQPLLFQSKNVFVSMADGSLVSLNILNGSTLWRADLGGSIIGQTIADANTVYIASQTTIIDEKKTPIIIVRALSSNTGITIWQKEFPAATKAFLVSNNNLLLLALSSGVDEQKVFALNAADGQTIWSQKIAAPITSGLSVYQNSLYFATKDRLLWNFKLSDGTIVKQFQIPHDASNRLILQDGLLFFSDTTGYVSAVRLSDKKTLWTLRFGAAVQDILPVDDKISFSSLDDFVYFHKISSGKRLWRKRISSRPLGISLISNATIGLIVSNESSGTILDLKTGKSIDLLNFGNDNSALGPPFFFNNYLIVLTNKGLQAFSPSSVDCQKK